MATYPSGIPSFTVPVSGEKLNNPNHITQHVQEDQEIVAIATELGTDPKGAYASVKMRLEGIESDVDLKAPISNPTFTGTVAGVTATMVGLGSVTNDAQVKRSEYGSKGALLVGTGAGTIGMLGVAATDGWALVADAASDEGVKWAAQTDVAAVWGSVTGTLADQTDLQTALDAKIAGTTYNAKGTLVVGTGSGVYGTLGIVATDGWFLVSDTASTGGIKWAASSASVSWGDISGTLANQTDLQSALDAKVDESLYSTKGVLLLGTGAGVIGTVPVAATNGYILTVNSTSASGVAWLAAPAGASAVWGSITGTLANQTDLQSALDAKVDESLYSTKGVLLLGTGAGVIGTVPVAATNGYILTVNSTSASGVAWLAAPAGSAAVWGSITGTLSNQTDLQSALDGKVDESLYSTKGILLLGTGSGTIGTVPVAATNGYVLAVNSTAAAGVAWVAASGGASVTRGTFTSSSLTSGTLTVTHSLGLAAPYSMIVSVFNNSGAMIIPDSVTGSTNSFVIDVTSYGTISGTYGYAYIAA